MHSLKLKKEEYKEKKRKERKKKERKKEKKKKKERHLCLTLPTWLNKADSLKEKKERRKKEKKKEERETFVFKTVCWCNIAGTLNICLTLTY